MAWARLAVATALFCRVCLAEVLTLAASPSTSAILVLHAFYVPARPPLGKTPTVSFSDLHAEENHKRKQRRSKGSVTSLEVFFILEPEFERLVNSHISPCDIGDFENEYPGVLRATVPVGNDERITFSYNLDGSQNGIYYFAVQSCGKKAPTTLTGSVTVKHSYGLLPAYAVSQKRFAFYVLGVYSLLLISKVVSMIMNLDLPEAHIASAVVVFLATLEACVRVIGFAAWSGGGSYPCGWFFGAVVFSSLKSCCAYSLLLAYSAGWTTARATSPISRLRGLFAVVAIFGSTSLREFAVAYQHSDSLTLSFVVLCSLPWCLITGATLLLSLSALSATHRTALERYGVDTALRVEKMRYVLMMAFILAALAVMVHTLTIPITPPARGPYKPPLLELGWQDLWLFSDAVPQVNFLVTLLFASSLWTPSHDKREVHIERKASQGI